MSNDQWQMFKDREAHKNNRAATSSPRRRPGSQSLGIVRRAKCPPTSTARFRRVRSVPVLMHVVIHGGSKNFKPRLCFPQADEADGEIIARRSAASPRQPRKRRIRIAI